MRGDAARAKGPERRRVDFLSVVSLEPVVTNLALPSFAALLALPLLAASGCNANDIAPENWTCDWDSSVNRPLADPQSPTDDAGLLPASECETTCGPPVSSCVRVQVDGGPPSAVCPVCVF
jgi:hypothetical protein